MKKTIKKTAVRTARKLTAAGVIFTLALVFSGLLGLFGRDKPLKPAGALSDLLYLKINISKLISTIINLSRKNL